MSYTKDSTLQSATHEAERQLLAAGFDYTEVAKRTGSRIKSISERNRLVYRIDIFDAYKARIERDGIPNRLTAAPAFCAWFTGIFDGEGSFVVFTRPCTARAQYSEFRLAVKITLRHDDANALQTIHDNFKVGTLHLGKGHGNGQPRVIWTCERIEDLAEVMMPIFDNHPLYTKKRHEYALWRPLVMRRYLDTMGGKSNRNGVAKDYAVSFDNTIKAFAKIRHGTRGITIAQVKEGYPVVG